MGEYITDEGGALSIIPVTKLYGAAAVEGQIGGVVPFQRSGNNDNVDTAFETVWCRSSLYTYLTTASKLNIISDSIQDAQNGTGARSVYIEGLDANYNVIYETLSLHPTDGRIAVTSVKSYLRVFTVKADTPGSNDSNVGNISIKNSDNSITLAYIVSNQGRCLACIYTVPADKTATILRWGYSELKAKISGVALFIKPFEKSWYIEKFLYLKDVPGNDLFAIPIICTEKTDIEIRAWATGGAGQITATFEGYYK